MRINNKKLMAMLIILLTFSGMLQNKMAPVLGYLDEAMECLLLFIIVLGYIAKRTDKHINRIVFFSIFLLSIGLAGNVLFKYQLSVKPIFIDVLASFKGIIYYVGVAIAIKSAKKSVEIIELTYKYIVFIAWIILPFAVLNQFFDIGMSHERVFGIKGFTFIANAEGNFSLVFYVFFSVLVCHIAINKRITVKTQIEIVLILMLCASTLRGRALAYVALFVLLYVMIFKTRKEKRKLGISQIVLIACIIILIGYDKIIYYFSANKTARYYLIYYGIVILKRLFPIGAGFATYGSAIASQYYSKLYVEFGFNSINGLAEGATRFANDGLWGELFGQFGFMGTAVCIYIYYSIYKEIKKQIKDKYEFFTVVYIFIILMIGSFGTKTMFHFVVSPTYMVLAMFRNYLVNKKYDCADELQK